MSEVQNANPTIFNPSELPTRRRRESSHSVKNPLPAIFANSIPSPSHIIDPFDSSTSTSSDSDNDDEVEPIDEQEIYGMSESQDITGTIAHISSPPIDLLSTISDPEHPLSLGSLGVVNLPDIHVKPLSRKLQQVIVEITPTITHCSLATVIGLCTRVRLEQALPPRFRVDVRIKEGTHSTGDQVNKQLADKERVAAAMENAQLRGMIQKMMETCQ
ncbi:MAG: hypothetical protein MMC33_010197 [Icmadophila ericetorum]|nr:hypothetical protein [Icmadophila ericetorum]